MQTNRQAMKSKNVKDENGGATMCPHQEVNTLKEIGGGDTVILRGLEYRESHNQIKQSSPSCCEFP
jgi:hypothetical protein